MNACSIASKTSAQLGQHWSIDGGLPHWNHCSVPGRAPHSRRRPTELCLHQTSYADIFSHQRLPASSSVSRRHLEGASHGEQVISPAQASCCIEKRPVRNGFLGETVGHASSHKLRRPSRTLSIPSKHCRKRGTAARASQIVGVVDEPYSSYTTSTPDLSYLELRDVGYQPPGCEKPILSDVNFTLDKHSMGLIFGRSGSGKTTLLQVRAYQI